MAQAAPPRHARALVRELGRGAHAVVSYQTFGASAYLERHGRRIPIDYQELERLIAGGFVAGHRQRDNEQTFRLTAKGRRAYRALTRPAWSRWLPWTPLQRLTLALLPVCWGVGMVATVVLGELGVRSQRWLTLGSAGAMLLPLIAAFVWDRWR